MSPISAGILLFRRRNSRTEVFLVHPGGPYWAQKEAGAWSVPKGLVNPGEEDLHVWAVEGDCNPSDLTSNLFEMEWPPNSGHKQQFPKLTVGVGLIGSRRSTI